jgi:hypothetical protein
MGRALEDRHASGGVMDDSEITVTTAGDGNEQKGKKTGEAESPARLCFLIRGKRHFDAKLKT